MTTVAASELDRVIGGASPLFTFLSRAIKTTPPPGTDLLARWLDRRPGYFKGTPPTEPRARATVDAP